MKNTLLIKLPIILIFSLLAGSIAYSYSRAMAYDSIHAVSELTRAEHVQKINNAIRNLDEIEKVKDFSIKMVSAAYNESQSIHGLLLTTSSTSKKDFELITWVSICIIILMHVLAYGLYPVIMTNSNKTVKRDQ